MLERTFCHVPGIGQKTERGLWKRGCRNWATYLDQPKEFPIGTASREAVIGTLKRSQDALAEGNHQFFAHRLGQKHAWRAFPAFRHQCLYLDIETDGSTSGNAVTIIGLYDGERFEALVKGENLECFRDRITHASLLVTFFGLGFDVPMLKKRFRGAVFDQIHFDLCPALREVGIRGGLKKIEKEFGLVREGEIAELTGYDAVKLWRRHVQLGDEKALKTLIEYNEADVVNLKPLAEIAYAKLEAATLGAPTLDL